MLPCEYLHLSLSFLAQTPSFCAKNDLIIDCDLFTKLIICLAQLPFAHFAGFYLKETCLHFLLKKSAVIYQIAVSYLISIFH